ncbi:MAG: 2-oxoacid:acceptor oxidoreductase family protein [Elusimicrobiota bacterium]
MVKKITEIRFHGRGGQGAKTASLLLGEAALDAGKYIQAFPEYGPERTGAPIKSYTRISNNEIRIHSGVKNPNAVVVIDPTLLETEKVMDGLIDKGDIIINTEKSPAAIKKVIKSKDSQNVYTVDATKIALDTINRPKTNVPMLGALVKVTGIVELEVLKEKIKNHFEEKLSSKAVEGNLEGIQRAYQEVETN